MYQTATKGVPAMFSDPIIDTNQPANYIVISLERTLVGKTPQYPAVHTFILVQDALDFINSRLFPNEWALFRTVELEEKQVTVSKMVVKQ